MEFPKLPNEHRKKSKSISFEKNQNRLLFMWGACERVNGACEFKK